MNMVGQHTDPVYDKVVSITNSVHVLEQFRSYGFVEHGSPVNGDKNEVISQDRQAMVELKCGRLEACVSVFQRFSPPASIAVMGDLTAHVIPYSFNVDFTGATGEIAGREPGGLRFESEPK